MPKLYSFIKTYKYPLLLVLLPLIFFSKALLAQNSMLYPAQDIISIFSQEKILFQDSIRNFGTLPLWNSYVFSGSPFLGNPTSAMSYPTNLLFLLFPVNYTFGLIFAINTILIGIFTYFFAKGIQLDKFSSFTCAIVIMFSGPMISLVFPGHLINLDTFVWFPLILLIYENAIKKQKIIYAILAGFPIALTMLAGAPQIAAFSLLSASIYYFLRAFTLTPRINKFSYFKKIIIIFIISSIVGVLLSAIQILPSNEFSKLSARSEGLSYEFASDFSLHPKQMISFILPFFFGDPSTGTYWGKGNFWSLNGYIGILPLIFAIIALIFKNNRLTIIFLILGLFALLFSLGKHAPIFPFFYNYVPEFNSFRAPSRFLYIYAFSLTILSGTGISVLIQKLHPLKKILLRLSIFIFLISIFVLTVSFFAFINMDIQFYEKYILKNSYAIGINHSILYSQMLNNILIFSVILLIFSILLLIKIKNKIDINTLKIFITLILLFDLWSFNSKIISIKKIADVYSTPDFINTITKDKDIFRIFDNDGLNLPVTLKNKIENITGVHSLYIKDYRDFIWSVGEHENKPYESFFQIKNIKNPIFLDLLNVKYVVSNSKTSINKNFLPRAYIVPNALVLQKNDILGRLKNKNFDPRREILLQRNPKVKLNNSSSFKEVKITHREPNKISMKVHSEGSGFLVLSEIDYPGWKAYDNGKELAIYNANYILRSIFLEKGPHDISFIYNPASYRLGKTISLLTLFFCVAYLIYNKAYSLDNIKKLFVI